MAEKPFNASLLTPNGHPYHRMLLSDRGEKGLGARDSGLDTADPKENESEDCNEEEGCGRNGEGPALLRLEPEEVSPPAVLPAPFHGAAFAVDEAAGAAVVVGAGDVEVGWAGLPSMDLNGRLTTAAAAAATAFFTAAKFPPMENALGPEGSVTDDMGCHPYLEPSLLCIRSSTRSTSDRGRFVLVEPFAMEDCFVTPISQPTP